MTASLETLVIAACVFATTFRIPRPGPVGKVSDEEIIALAVAQAISGAVSDRRFLGTIGRLLPGFFPDLPGQAQYNRRLRRLTPWITTVQLSGGPRATRSRRPATRGRRPTTTRVVDFSRASVPARPGGVASRWLLPDCYRTVHNGTPRGVTTKSSSDTNPRKPATSRSHADTSRHRAGRTRCRGRAVRPRVLTPVVEVPGVEEVGLRTRQPVRSRG